MINIYVILFSLVCLVSSIAGFVSNIGYHAEIGVPRAYSIKLYEESIQGVEGLERVVHGSAVVVGQIPFQAGILITLTSGWTSICGGSLVSNTRVITAAHCWFDGGNQARTFTVVLGSVNLFSGGTRRDTSDVEVHPMWNPDYNVYDVAVVRINAVEFNNNIFPIPVPSVSYGSVDISGKMATTSGYGKTSDSQSTPHMSATLHLVELLLINNTECEESVPDLHLSQVCGVGGQGSGVGGQGSGVCAGDDGGPLSVVEDSTRILVGITATQPSNACERGYPSVFTRLAPILPWIHTHL